MRRLAVQLEVFVDGELFLGRALPPGRPLRLGPGAGCEVPTSALPTTLALLTPTRDGYSIRLAPSLAGLIHAAGRSLRVGDGLLHDPRPEPLLLVEGDRGELSLGAEVRLRFTVVAAAPLFRGLPGIDAPLALSLGGTLAAAAMLVLLVGRFSPPLTPAGGHEVRLRSRPAVVALSRLRSPIRKPQAPAPTTVRAPRATESRRATPTPRSIARAGLLGLLDARLDRATPSRRHDPLAALDRLLTSTESLLTSSTAGYSGLAPSRRRRSEWGMSGFAEPGAVPAARKRPRLPEALAALPRPAPGEPGLSREAVQEVVAQGAAAIRLCYERELLSTVDVREGRLVLRWRIDSGGRATAIRVEKDSVGLPELRSCLRRQIQSWVFPPCPGRCEVTYPFEFFAR